MMKNFNIEDLPRKNIYKTPDFFAEMQENVLQKTVYNIQPHNEVENIKPKKSNNWIYSAAASVAVILGISAFWMNSGTENKAKSEVAKNDTNTVKYEQPVEQMVANPDFQDAKTGTQTFAVADSKEIATTRPAKIEAPKMPKVVDRIIVDPPYVSNKDLAQNDIDKVINTLSSKDLAEMSNDADTDVYLDLYN